MTFSCHLLINLVVTWEKKRFLWVETIRKIRLNWQKFSISLMENRQKIASHPTELSLFPWELNDRKITKTHKEISNILDSKPTGKSINLTIADSVLDLMTLLFLSGIRQRNTVRKIFLSGGSQVNSISLSTHPWRDMPVGLPTELIFLTVFPEFLTVFWHTGIMVFPVVKGRMTNPQACNEQR